MVGVDGLETKTTDQQASGKEQHPLTVGRQFGAGEELTGKGMAPN